MRNRKIARILVSVPATSANLGCGFDCCGLALRLYNTFLFVPSDDTDSLSGFGEYNSPSDNLVLQSLRKVYDAPVSIRQIDNNVPLSRGLGSSATCIVAGISAGLALKGEATANKSVVFDMATQIEGHPDNVCPAVYGGLTCAYRTEKAIGFRAFHINKSLRFSVVVPSEQLSTSVMRQVLPSSLTYAQAVNNISRVTMLPLAYAKGDLALLDECVKDQIHQPYRLPHIPFGKEIFDIAKTNGFVGTISGAGSSLLLVGKKYFDNKLLPEQFAGKVLHLEPDYCGVTTEIFYE